MQLKYLRTLLDGQVSSEINIYSKWQIIIKFIFCIHLGATEPHSWSSVVTEPPEAGRRHCGPSHSTIRRRW